MCIYMSQSALCVCACIHTYNVCLIPAGIAVVAKQTRHMLYVGVALCRYISVVSAIV